MKAIRLVSIWAALLFLLGVTAAAAETLKLPLYEIAPVKTVDLRCTAAQYGLKIPVSDRWDIKKATLHFSYVNSSALIPQNSRLVVKLNGYPLAQIRLSPVVPEGEAAVSLPPRLLKSGYNDLSFMVSQHYTLECEDPCAPELWTTLKLAEAYIQVEYGFKPVPLRLSAIANFLFDPKAFATSPVHFVLEKPSSEILTVAGQIASGVALRYDYRKTIFSASDDIRPGADNILLGEKAFVEAFLSRRGLRADIKGPALKILHLPGARGADNRQAMIVVSGADLEAVKLAGRTLAILSFPFPGTPDMEVKQIDLPAVSSYTGKLIITTGETYSFKNLGFRTTSFKGMRPGGGDIVFRLPTDLMIRPNQWIDLRLHLAYGAGMRSDSVMNILVNGQFTQAIHLSEPHGAIYNDYKISIPTYLLKRGHNVITFDPVMTPLITGYCEFIQQENLFLTLFDDSRLYIPSMPHWVEMPSMELFFQDGYPLTRWPDGRDILIYLANTDNRVVGTALNMAGLVSQKIGYPLLELKMTTEKPKDWSGEMVVVGDVQSIPEDIRKSALLKLTTPAVAPYTIGDVRRGDAEMSFWEKVKKFISSPFGKGELSSLRIARSVQTSGLGPGVGALMEFQSPFETGRSVLLLTAETTDDLEKAGRAILESSVQSGCQGGVALLDLTGDEFKVSSAKGDETYYSGKLGLLSKFDFFLRIRPWLFYGLLVLAVVALGWAIFHLLRKQRERRMRDEKDLRSGDS